MNFFGFENKNKTDENPVGFIFSHQGDDVRIFQAAPGDRITNWSKQPPWIVVHKTLEAVTITKWPGRLLEAEILNAKNEADINAELREDADYIRTTDVRIVNELPVEKIFSNNGKQLCMLFDRIVSISIADVHSLAKQPVADARNIYAKIWKRWERQKSNVNPRPLSSYYNLIYSAPDNKNYSSPVMQALSVVSSLFDKRVRQLAGKNGFFEDEEEEEYLTPLWKRTENRLLFAAMAYAPPHLVTSEESEQLLKPYRAVFGS